MVEVKYYIYDISGKNYLIDYDFRNTTNTEWTRCVRYAVSFDTQKSAWAIKTYIEDVCKGHRNLKVIKSTTVYEEVEGME